MSHPSQAHPGFGWLGEKDFVKQAGKPALAGLPSKHIHVDTDKQPGPSEQTAGQLYSDQIGDAVHAEPVLVCPNCHQPACGVAGGSQPYMRDVKESGGKTHKADIPACPVAGIEIPKLVYAVDPCGCKVAQEWASAFTAELQSRLMGNKPKDFAWLTEKERRAKIQKWENALTRLYQFQAMAGDTETKKDADYWIVVCVDQIQRLCPGGHNRAKTQIPLHREVKEWAAQNGLTVPSEQNFAAKPAGIVMGVDPAGGSSFTAGAICYAQGDGSFSPVPPQAQAQAQAQAQQPADPGFGYGPEYKPPAGFKGAQAPLGGAAGGKVYKLLDGQIRIVLPDGYDRTFSDFTAAAAHMKSLKEQIDQLSRKRSQHIFELLTPLGKAYVADVAAKLNPELPMLSDTDKFEIWSRLYKNEWHTKDAPVAHPPIPKASKVGSLGHSAFMQQMMQDAQYKLMNSFFGPALGEPHTPAAKPAGTPPKPKPKLQTLPAGWDEKINFFGAKPEEKEAYLQGLQGKKMAGVQDLAAVPVTPAVLKAIADRFEYDKGLMTSLVRQEILMGQGDTVTLLETASNIQKDIQRWLKGEGTVLSAVTLRFVVAFTQLVAADLEETAKAEAAPTAPKPVPAAPPAPKTRHVKKRRTIRPFEDAE